MLKNTVRCITAAVQVYLPGLAGPVVFGNRQQRSDALVWPAPEDAGGLAL